MKNFSKITWAWVPSLYFAEGLPNVIVVTVSVLMYKNLGVSNSLIALYTSWLYLPWVIKPLWSPVVDLLRTKRFWILSMQVLIGAGLAGVAFTIPAPGFLQYTLAFLWLVTFSSATHDIAADGFYMIALPKHEQSFFVGIRSTFYRLSVLAGQGPLIILAGHLEKSTGNIPYAWIIAFSVLAGLFLLFFIYHTFILPRPADDKPAAKEPSKNFFSEFFRTFALFFRNKSIGTVVTFILVYRLGEAQLAKMAIPFLRDPLEKGGLGLATDDIGLVYGTFGVIALTLGGILGGIVASRNGLKYWLWPMIIAINVPDLVYVYLSYSQNTNLFIVGLMVVIEQLGYGFGFTAFILYLIYVSEGEYKTSHYAIATGLMALGLMLPGMASGWIQEMIGYRLFFIWVCIATIPAFIIARYIPLDPEFGKKTERTHND